MFCIKHTLRTIEQLQSRIFVVDLSECLFGIFTSNMAINICLFLTHDDGLYLYIAGVCCYNFVVNTCLFLLLAKHLSYMSILLIVITFYCCILLHRYFPLP